MLLVSASVCLNMYEFCLIFCITSYEFAYIFSYIGHPTLIKKSYNMTP